MIYPYDKYTNTTLINPINGGINDNNNINIIVTVVIVPDINYVRIAEIICRNLPSSFRTYKEGHPRNSLPFPRDFHLNLEWSRVIKVPIL